MNNGTAHPDQVSPICEERHTASSIALLLLAASVLFNSGSLIYQSGQIQQLTAEQAAQARRIMKIQGAHDALVKAGKSEPPLVDGNQQR